MNVLLVCTLGCGYQVLAAVKSKKGLKCPQCRGRIKIARRGGNISIPTKKVIYAEDQPNYRIGGIGLVRKIKRMQTRTRRNLSR